MLQNILGTKTDMKKAILVISALLAGVVCYAQQTIGMGGQQIVSPEIHPDNTVTFRFSAPKAVRVQLSGDFLPMTKTEVPGFGTFETQAPVDLKEGKNGIWEYTTSVLEPELYSYNFIVDGISVKDPNNSYVLRDIATLMNYFIIDGDRTENYVVKDVPHGTVSRVWYHSDVLGKDRRMAVYTPAGYETSKEKYPVFYLLHGMGGDEEAWLATGRMEQILDNLIASGKAKPMIVVMTNGNTVHKAAPGESEEGNFKPYNSGSFDTSFEAHFKDVISFVDSRYRTIKKPSGRAIAGLSMGGLHSYEVSLNYPKTFDYVGLFSAALGVQGGDKMLAPELYENADAKIDALFANNPKLYYIAIGNTDFLYAANKAYRDKLDAKGYKYEYVETDGGHIWRNWRIYLEDFAQRIFK